jgi:hypothetical protein
MDITGISKQSSKEKMVNLGRNLQEIRTLASVPQQTPPTSWAPSN